MENKIIVSQNFIYAFAKTVGEGHGLNKGKTVIEIITVEVPVAPATGNDILIDNLYYFIVMEKFVCSMLYLILTLMMGIGHEKPWVLL